MSLLDKLNYDVSVLVCGGRDYDDYDRVKVVLDYIQANKNIIQVTHGDANGADRLGGRWGKENNIPVETYPANWRMHHRNAGFIRNQQMLDEEHIDLVIAFPGGNGTADMVRRAKSEGIPVLDAETVLV